MLLETRAEIKVPVWWPPSGCLRKNQCHISPQLLVAVCPSLGFLACKCIPNLYLCFTILSSLYLCVSALLVCSLTRTSLMEFRFCPNQDDLILNYILKSPHFQIKSYLQLVRIRICKYFFVTYFNLKVFIHCSAVILTIEYFISLTKQYN